MVDVWVYDVTFMVLFSLYIIWFLKSRKKDWSREGIIFLYRTQAGVKFIKYIGDTYKKTLDSLKYVIVSVGVVLMSAMIWMLWQTLSIYLYNPRITEVIKAPPIAPLIPYFPKLFGLESFFPPFYFTYFIVALAIVAVVHEFSHGIFMRRFGVKIKSTGLVFLGPILGAFVEEEKKGFEKKKRLEQMTILGAGVFANIVFALIFYGLYVLFFFIALTASGYAFNSYAAEGVPLNLIDDIGQDVGTKTVFLRGQAFQVNLTEVGVGDRDFYISTETKEFILNGIDLNESSAILFHKAPALENNFLGVIIEANGVKINNQDSLREFLESVDPGDSVNFITSSDGVTKEYDLVLESHPEDPNRAYIGIAHSEPQPRGIVGKFLFKFMSFKESSVHYAPAFGGEFTLFVYNLFWWVMIINLLVALFNMMPLGILDGGRFFYLAVLSVTGSERFAKGAFKFATYAITFVFVFLMFIWFIRVF